MAGRLVLLLALFAFAGRAWALSVGPPRTEVRLAPGGETKAIITIDNPDKEAYDVEITEKPWFVYPENKEIKVHEWLLLPKTTVFRLKAGKRREVEIRLKCPPNAVGELMGMVSVAYRKLKPEMITPMISTAVYIRVIGTEKILGEVRNLTAKVGNKMMQTGVQVRNTGNVRIIPKGTIQVLDSKGTVLQTYEVPEAQPLFPTQARDYTAAGSQEEPPAGRYVLEAKLSYGTLELTGKRGMEIAKDGSIQLDPEPGAPPPAKESKKP